MHRYSRLVWSFVALVTLAGTAFAQDGLQRFERDIKPQLEFESFVYSSASALGPNGFVLNNVTAVVPASPQTGDKPTTVKVDKVTVEEFDFERVPKAGLKDKGADGDVPRFARIKLEGIAGDDDLNKLLTPYGISKVPVDAALDYRLDPASKVMTVNKLELSLRGLARAEINLVMDGVSDKASKIEGSKEDGRLRTATIVFEDKGLLAKLLPAMARESGSTAEIWVAVAQAPLQGFAAGQGPESLKVLDAVVSYLGDWKAPKGPLRVTINPPRTTGLNDLDKLMIPNALTEVFGLAVTYEGTRPGAAGSESAGGATGAAPAPTPRAQRATPPRSATSEEAPAPEPGTLRLSGKAAWDTVVGNTLTGRLDGKTYHDFYRKDGKLVSLQEGEISTGKWSLEGEKVCIKYPDEDKDCYTVVALGRTVTMTDAKGKGFRATLLRGNPKDL
jgi:hypothetical protein